MELDFLTSHASVWTKSAAGPLPTERSLLSRSPIR
jgi:hypothetical protein